MYEKQGFAPCGLNVDELVLPEECRIQVTRIYVALYALHSTQKQRQCFGFWNWWCVFLQVLI